MPKRDAAHMDAQREKIIRAAIECIGDKGIERTSISDICRKAELSAGAQAAEARAAKAGAGAVEACLTAQPLQSLPHQPWHEQ